MQPILPIHNPPQRLAVKLKPKSEKYVKMQHPWIFESSIEKISGNGQYGDLAIIYGSKTNKLLAIGLLDVFSPIRIKLLAFGKGVAIDQEWFDDMISTAYGQRMSLISDRTDAYRLIFGENDGLPGLIVDVYAGVAVVKIYSSIWFPYLEFIRSSLINIVLPYTIILRLSRSLQVDTFHTIGYKDGMVIYGQLDDEVVTFQEYGIRFSANVIKGHKTGYFLDHRVNRHLIGQMANGKKVLDIFSYAGGFSVHALVGGATCVTSVDISKQALQMAAINGKLNLENPNHTLMDMDAFDAMALLIQKKEKFDIVVVDPPSFAKQASDVDIAMKSYERLASLAIQLVKTGGTCMMASCSSRVSADDFFECVEKGFDKSGRTYRLVQKTFHDIDHPVHFPEGNYLKSGYYVIG